MYLCAEHGTSDPKSIGASHPVGSAAAATAAADAALAPRDGC